MKNKLLIIVILIFISCKKENSAIKENKTKQEKEYVLDFKDFPYDPIKVDLTGDKIEEYIYEDIEGVFVFDGKSRKAIPTEYIISKSGMEFPIKIIDVVCNDNQKEMLLQSSGGGTIGNYHSLHVLRYDKKANKINSIFDYEISSFNWQEDKEILEVVNYIDVLYKNDNDCVDEIKIFKGQFIGVPKPYKTEIKPKKILETFYFNRLKNKFEKKDD